MDSNPTTAPKGPFCPACGTRLAEGAQFCHQCGAKAGSAAPAPTSRNVLPWSVAAIALIAVVALLAGQSFGRGAASGEAMAPPTVDAGGRPPDISSMSPQERADRLFDRVMRYASEGKNDSAQFFAPMAMGAIEAMAPLTAHLRYDLGLLALATGDAARARTEADAILAAQPTHLLGLVLAGRAAEARGDAAAKSAFDKKLVASEATEKARNLEEYTDHANDLNAAIAAARGKAR